MESDGAGTPQHRGLRNGLLIAWHGTVLVVVQSLVFGLAVLPALLFWESVRLMPIPDRTLLVYARIVIIAMSLIPAYLLFAVGLMAFSSTVNKLFGWRSSEGEYSMRDVNPKLVKWGSYNASINVVRLFAGEALRATPMWTMYLKWNGAKIGDGVYVNTARLYDHNLLHLGDGAVVGGDAKLIAHLVEGGKVKASPVVLGRRAVVGVNSVVGPGVRIGDNSTVGAVSFVPKDTRIPDGEIWGGVPARPVSKVVTVEKEPRQPGVPRTS